MPSMFRTTLQGPTLGYTHVPPMNTHGFGSAQPQLHLPYPHGVTAMQPPTNAGPTPATFHGQPSSTTQGAMGGNSAPGSVSLPVDAFGTLSQPGPGVVLDPGPPLLPRSSAEQAVLFENTSPEEFRAILREMEVQIQATTKRLAEHEEHTASQITDLVNELAELKIAMSEGAVEGSRVRDDGISVNDHPTLKDAIHELAWHFIGLEDYRKSKECWAKLGELRPHPNGLAMEEINDGESQRFYPNFRSGMNHATNQVFIKALANQAYDNETRFRANQGGQIKHGWKTLPDASYNLKVMAAVAEEYWISLARRWRERQSPSGIQRRKDTDLKNNSRSRRHTKNRNRMRMAHLVERLYGLKGAASLCVTDYASSQYSEKSDGMTTDSRARRQAQGCGRGGKRLQSRLWRRRAYVRFLRFLDYLLALEQQCKLSRLEGVSVLKEEDQINKKKREAKKSASDVAPEGSRPAKRARVGNSGEATGPEISKLIKEPKKPRTVAKSFYQDAWANGDARPPQSTGKNPRAPYEFMVRRTWLREHEKGGNFLEMRPASELPWWGEFEITDDMLLPDDIALLNEIPDSEDEHAGEGVGGENN
ncbi:hypothetical protein C8Q79DRAFT_923833 [Trametes meyenii]|nr:hypothetical protein C8Q79DRAFT_923833 [Trametes meyenii]